MIASQLPAGTTIDMASGPRESVPTLPSELRPKAVVALDRILVHADAEVGHWFDRAKGERWLANVVQIRLAIQDDPPPVINYTSAGPMATTPSVVAPIPQQAPTQPEASTTEAPRRRRPVFAGQQFVQGRLGVDEVWELRDRHSEATAAHALAELVERQVGEVDTLDRELRAVASRAAEALAPIVQGNGVLRFTGVELETLGARFDLARQELQNLVARYERTAAEAPVAPSRETAARARSTTRLTGTPTALPATGVPPTAHRPLHL